MRSADSSDRRQSTSSHVGWIERFGQRPYGMRATALENPLERGIDAVRLLPRGVPSGIHSPRRPGIRRNSSACRFKGLNEFLYVRIVGVAPPIIIEMVPEVVRFAFAQCGNLLPQGKVVITLDRRLIGFVWMTIWRNASACEL